MKKPNITEIHPTPWKLVVHPKGWGFHFVVFDAGGCELENRVHNEFESKSGIKKWELIIQRINSYDAFMNALIKVVEAKVLILPTNVRPEHRGEVEVLSNIMNECKQALKKAGVEL